VSERGRGGTLQSFLVPSVRMGGRRGLHTQGLGLWMRRVKGVGQCSAFQSDPSASATSGHGPDPDADPDPDPGGGSGGPVPGGPEGPSAPGSVFEPFRKMKCAGSKLLKKMSLQMSPPEMVRLCRDSAQQVSRRFGQQDSIQWWFC